jgi:hypothetical protein
MRDQAGRLRDEVGQEWMQVIFQRFLFAMSMTTDSQPSKALLYTFANSLVDAKPTSILGELHGIVLKLESLYFDRHELRAIPAAQAAIASSTSAAAIAKSNVDSLIPIAQQAMIMHRLPLLWPLWWLISRSELPRDEPLVACTAQFMLGMLNELDRRASYFPQIGCARCRWMVFLAPACDAWLFTFTASDPIYRDGGALSFFSAFLNTVPLNRWPELRLVFVAARQAMTAMDAVAARVAVATQSATTPVTFVSTSPSGVGVMQTRTLRLVPSVSVDEMARAESAIVALDRALNSGSADPGDIRAINYTSRVIVCLNPASCNQFEALCWASGLLHFFCYIRHDYLDGHLIPATAGIHFPLVSRESASAELQILTKRVKGIGIGAAPGPTSAQY